MVEKYTKNSLLGQLEEKGLYHENNQKEGCLPFGFLTGGIESSPFEINSNQINPIIHEQKIVQKRLNEMDNDFFQEGSFIDIKDSDLSKDEKIKKIKKLIKKIDEKIFMLEDSDDKFLIEKLKSEKSALMDALNLLNTKGFNSKNQIQKDEDNDFNKIEALFFKLFPLLKKNFLVKKALNKLVMLNESAKSAIDKKIPYGESEGRYNDFITYLSCANVIHAKLTKKM